MRRRRTKTPGTLRTSTLSWTHIHALFGVEKDEVNGDLEGDLESDLDGDLEGALFEVLLKP